MGHDEARQWTRKDCARLAVAGVLNYRYELVEGEIIKKAVQSLPHRIAITLITAWLYTVYGAVFIQYSVPGDH